MDRDEKQYFILRQKLHKEVWAYFNKCVDDDIRDLSDEEVEYALGTLSRYRMSKLAEASGISQETWGTVPTTDEESIELMRQCWAGVKTAEAFNAMASEQFFSVLFDLHIARHYVTILPILLARKEAQSEDKRKALRFVEALTRLRSMWLYYHILLVWKQSELPDEASFDIALQVLLAITLKDKEELFLIIGSEHDHTTIEKLFIEIFSYLPDPVPLDFGAFQKARRAIHRQIKKDLQFISLRDKAIDLTEDIPTGTIPPLERMIQQERLREVWQELKEAERETATLLADGLTYEEVAERRGESVSAVYKRMERLRERLENKRREEGD